LEDLGLLESARDGNRRTYKAVRSQRFDDLLALFSRPSVPAATTSSRPSSRSRGSMWLGDPMAPDALIRVLGDTQPLDVSTLALEFLTRVPKVDRALRIEPELR
jgi:hypothetical protein